MSRLTPEPADKFTFGLWTVGNRGRDPFGEPIRPVARSRDLGHTLAELGAYGVNFHDNDLVPIDATPADRDRIVRDFRRALDATGMKVPMATTNLFTDPAFKDGAFTSNDPDVRAYALQKTMRAMDLGVELGREHLRVLGRTRRRGGGRSQGSGQGHQAVPRGPELSVRLRARSEVRAALRARSQAERAARRHLLPDNRRVSRLHSHARASRHGRRQPGGRARAHGGTELLSTPWRRRSRPASCFTSISTIRSRDASTRICGSDQSRSSRSSSSSSCSRSPATTDRGTSTRTPIAPRSEDGVWDFARGCMRTYLILKDKARQFREHRRHPVAAAEIHEARAAAAASVRIRATSGATLLARTFDREALAARPLPYEQLDQLVVDLLLGV